MEEKHFSNIKWDNFPQHMKTMLFEMMKSSHLTDVTLVCDDKIQISTHKFVLSACSEVFKTLVRDIPPNISSVIYLRGINYKDMKAILDLMYLGTTSIEDDEAKKLLEVARDLEAWEIFRSIDLFIGDKKLSDGDIEINTKGEDSSLNDNNLVSDDFKALLCSYDYCDYKTKDKCNLKKHIRNIHDKRKYACNECKKEYTDQSSLKKHTDSIHKGVRYACSQCNHEAYSPNALDKHIESKHMGVTYSCDFCEFESVYKQYLTQHIEAQHEGKTYRCDICDLELSSKQCLKRHTEAKHDKTRQQCSQCNYSASSKKTLRVHIRFAHEGVTFNCDECDYKAKGSSGSYNLKIHTKSKHKAD